MSDAWMDERWDDGTPLYDFQPDYVDNGDRNTKRNEYQDRGRDRYNGGNGGVGRGGGGGRRNYDHSKTIDLWGDCIGRIIGRGGSNIKNLQTEFNVRVDLDKMGRTVTVSGNQAQDVENALKRIEQQIESGNRFGGGSGGGGRSYENRRNDYGESNGNRNFESEIPTYEPEPQKEEEEKPFVPIDWELYRKQSAEQRAARWAKLPVLTKDFYQEVPEVAQLSAAEVARIRAENNNISVSRVFEQEDGIPENIPNPVWKFEQCFAPYPDLLAEIEKQKFPKPSPIQAQAWPILLKGEDLIGIAQTGTGKTLAFLLPAMIHTEYQSTPRSQRGGPNVLVMAPTRELALQIEKEVNKYSFRGMKAVCLYGGGSRREQIHSVEGGVEIIICTPGRLNDLIQAKVIDITSVTYLVLDEADRMLDMGFEPQIRKIMLDIRPDRQTIMTSATWPPGVRRLAQSYMSNPIQVCVGSLDLAATHSVKQIIKILDEGDKYYEITNFIKNLKPIDKAIVFCGKKARADDLASDLTLEGFECTTIHGNRDQIDREQAIADITSGEVKILVATDVASRGLDIEDITYVINFDFPRNIEEYVHRVGRTGRAGRTGTSISYLTREDWGVAKELINILEEANQEVPEELLGMAERFKAMKQRRANEPSKFGGGRRGGGGGRGGGGKQWFEGGY